MPSTEFTDVGQHYELMIDEIDDPAHPITDPFHDEGWLRDWLAQSDGTAFFQSLGDVNGKTLLEIGVGTGRVAKKMLDLGCAQLTGIDISPKTLERAQRNLAAYTNVELVLANAETFLRPNTFDLAYCVWAFFHIADQPRALANIIASLRMGGTLVISLEHVDECLDYGPRKIRQFPVTPEQVVEWLGKLGCLVEPPVMVYDAFVKPPQVLTTIIKGIRHT
ncbi:MAG: class I SAM-dependent methyltransferase [Armatimonadota bacterium]